MRKTTWQVFTSLTAKRRQSVWSVSRMEEAAARESLPVHARVYQLLPAAGFPSGSLQTPLLEDRGLEPPLLP